VLDALSTLYAADFGLIAKPIRNAPSLSLDLLWAQSSSMAALAPAFAQGLAASCPFFCRR